MNKPQRPRLTCEQLEDRSVPAVAFTLGSVGLGSANLIGFDTAGASASTATTTAITNLDTGEMLVGIDFRPQNGQLYALGVNATGTGTLYTISTRTGLATPVGGTGLVTTTDGLPNPATAGVGFAFDFNPAADAIRVVASDGDNFVISPNSGTTAANQTSYTTPIPTAGAYTNNAANETNTTLYLIDAANGTLVFSPAPASNTVTTVGALGTGPISAVNGFDIPFGVNTLTSGTAVSAGEGFAVMNVGGTTGGYSINLTTGSATLIASGLGTVTGLAVQNDYAGFPALGLASVSAGAAILVRFNTATPGTTTPVTMSGIDANEMLVGIDFRPQTGQLYGFGVNGTGQGTLYLINPQSGAATVVGQPTFVDATGNPVSFPDPSAAGYGFDFNPTADRIRVVTSTGLNFRLDPDTGLGVDGNAGATGTQPDGTINGDSSGVTGTAYTNSFGQSLTGGTTTQYTLDAIGNTLFIQTPPNAGTNGSGVPVTVSGTPLDFTDVNGFDIPAGVRVTSSGSAASGFGYASILDATSTFSLYRINLTTGEATALGGSSPLSALALGDAPAGAVAFTSATFSVTENGGSANITLTRTGGTSGAVSVTVNITAGTADSSDIGIDGPYTVTFADGATTATLIIPIVNDSTVEANETLTFQLANPTNGAVLGALTTTVLTIINDDVTPPSPPATGGGVFGVGAQVIANGTTSTPYAGFQGTVTTARGDVTGDGIADIITGAGAGSQGGHVKVFDGATGAEVRSFFAFSPLFLGGVNVGAGDVNGDGVADVIVGTANGSNHVRVFDGTTGAEIRSFFAFSPLFAGGVNVASGDVDGDGKDDIITGAGAGAPPHVRVFSGANGSELRSFFAYPLGFLGGVFVASGDVNGDGKDDIITGAGAGAASHVQVFDGATNARLASFFAFHPSFTGGVRVGARDVNGDGKADIVTGVGPGALPHVRTVDGTKLNQVQANGLISEAALLESLYATDALISSGVYVS